jgi:NADH-quinone oxidoreductase subunit E
VATFYTMYKRSPTGEYLVSVCTNTLCAMLGGDDIYQALSQTLGVGMNETAGTPGAPGSITLEHAECLAACDYAPVVTVNYEFFDNQTVDSALGLVTELRAGNRPMPTRGAPLCSFSEISRQIAGFVDQRPAATRATGTGLPTEAGVRLAQERGELAPGYPPDEDAGSSSTEAETAAADNTGKPDYTSSNDAPLNTFKSDPAADSPTGGQSERIDKAGPTDEVARANNADKGK